MNMSMKPRTSPSTSKKSPPLTQARPPKGRGANPVATAAASRPIRPQPRITLAEVPCDPVVGCRRSRSGAGTGLGPGCGGLRVPDRAGHTTRPLPSSATHSTRSIPRSPAFTLFVLVFCGRARSLQPDSCRPTTGDPVLPCRSIAVTRGESTLARNVWQCRQ